MEENRKKIQLNFKQFDWKIPLIVCIACFYLAVFGDAMLNGKKISLYTGDYLAFWSVGRIANEKGYSEIYDLRNLESVQSQGLTSLGFIEGIDGPPHPILPVPYFAFFVLPFQSLSKVPIVTGYWLWTISNLAILIGYLTFFVRKIISGSVSRISSRYLISIILIAYPVFMNFLSAQVEVFLVIFAGEFIRSAIGKKPILSGIWLGGLLLKPQLLILVIPIFLITRHWKVLLGFIVSSGVILMSSILLSGLTGMQGLITLWTEFSAGIASNSLSAMINWRMVGININTFTGTSIGWVITGLGTILTFLATYLLLMKKPTFGSPQWVKSMLGVFSATLALTWHSHFHMAMVIIPFLVYVWVHQLLPKKVIFAWATVTPIVLFVIMFLDLFVQVILRSKSLNYDALVVAAFSGFMVNLLVLFYTLRPDHNQNLQQYELQKNALIH